MAPKPKPKKAPAKKAAPKAAPKSSPKAETKPPTKEPAKKTTATVSVDVTGCVPIDAATGLPLLKISVSASELIPTGEYANVTVGPVTGEKWIVDPQDDDVLAEVINDFCELIEVGVVSEQREIVLSSLQAGADS